MKWLNLLIIVLVFISSVSSREKRRTRRIKNALKYVGCKPEDTICDKRPRHYCRFKNFRFQCPRKCGLCAPYEPKCAKEHVYGCCWDGTPATDIEKSNCPACLDVNNVICKRFIVKKDCDFSKKTRLTRVLCPETCRACGDFGNKNPLGEACVDKDRRCYDMKDTSCCEDNKILQDLCPKTCGVCYG